MDEKGIYTPLHNGKYDSDIKPTPFIDERASTSYLNVTRNSARPWRASFFNAPIIEILAVVSSLVFAGSSMCILLLSDGSPIHSWSLTPSVYLSIITAGTNNLLRFAFSKGVSISWWNQALHGTTLEDLHLTWKYGASFLSTLLPPFARHKFSIIRLTSFLLAVLVADGPLLQRSLSVAPTQMSSTSLKAFPDRLQPMVNLTSHFDNLSDKALASRVPFYEPEFLDALSGMRAKTPIKISAGICNGTCTTTVTVAGFDRNCTISQVDSWRKLTLTKTMQDAINNTRIYKSTDLKPQFQLESTYQNTLGGIKISTFFQTGTSKNNDSDTFVAYDCLLNPAFLEMDLTIANNSITMASSIPKVKATYEVPLPFVMIGAFAEVISNLYDAYVLLSISSPTYDFVSGSSSRTFINSSTAVPGSFVKVAWRDPMPELFSDLDELSLRYAMETIPATVDRLLEWELMLSYFSHSDSDIANLYAKLPNLQFGTVQNVLVTDSKSVLVYKVMPAFFAGAVALIFLAIVSTAITLAGWWNLGRNVGISPLELVKAFDQGIVEEVGSNMSETEILKMTGSKRVQYGSIMMEPSSGIRRRLIVGCEGETRVPKNGVEYY